MNLLGPILKGIGAIATPIAGVFTAKTKANQVIESGKQKIQQAQVDGANSLNLTDAEWEAVNANKQDTTWKDEYVTVTMTVWVWIAMVGALAAAFGKPQILDGVKIFMEVCTQNNVDIGYLTIMVVGAAVGLKLWRGR